MITGKVQDDSDRDGGMRSALIVLRDGSRFNMFFGGDQLPLSESYESCASKLHIVVLEKPILRFRTFL